jgi:hypothetical protein
MKPHVSSMRSSLRREASWWVFGELLVSRSIMVAQRCSRAVPQREFFVSPAIRSKSVRSHPPHSPCSTQTHTPLLPASVYLCRHVLEMLLLQKEDNSAPVDEQHMCVTHPAYPLDVFCVDCDQPICLRCAHVTHHQTHKREEIRTAFDRFRRETQPLMEKTQQKLAIYEVRVKEVQNMKDQVPVVRAIQTKRLRHYFESLHAELRRREEQLSIELDTAASEREDALKQQKEELDMSIAMMHSSVAHCQDLLKHSNDSAHALLFKRLMRQPLVEKVLVTSLQPVRNADFEVHCPSDIVDQIRLCGAVVQPPPPEEHNATTAEAAGVKHNQRNGTATVIAASTTIDPLSTSRTPSTSPLAASSSSHSSTPSFSSQCVLAASASASAASQASTDALLRPVVCTMEGTEEGRPPAETKGDKIRRIFSGFPKIAKVLGINIVNGDDDTICRIVDRHPEIAKSLGIISGDEDGFDEDEDDLWRISRLKRLVQAAQKELAEMYRRKRIHG